MNEDCTDAKTTETTSTSASACTFVLPIPADAMASARILAKPAAWDLEEALASAQASPVPIGHSSVQKLTNKMHETDRGPLLSPLLRNKPRQ